MTRILVVDDNEHNREYARQVLAEQFEVEVAEDGVEALALIEAAPPDLVLLDLSMPRLDGWGVIRALRDDPTHAGLPIVACSAHAMRGDQERALAAGFDAYLTKPYRPNDLVQCLAPYVGAGATTTVDDGWGGEGWSLNESDWESEESS